MSLFFVFEFYLFYCLMLSRKSRSVTFYYYVYVKFLFIWIFNKFSRLYLIIILLCLNVIWIISLRFYAFITRCFYYENLRCSIDSLNRIYSTKPLFKLLLWYCLFENSKQIVREHCTQLLNVKNTYCQLYKWV